MLKTLSFIAVLAMSSAQANEVVTSTVHSIEWGQGKHETLIKFSNGRVAFAGESLRKSLESLGDAQDRLMEASLDDQSGLVSFKLLPNETKSSKSLQDTDPPVYNPTVLGSIEEVKEIFDNLNADYKRRSECSDRAHVWSWELFKEENIYSEKVFAFFTASYINRHRFKWWFHVAPLVSVQTTTGVEKMVLDYQFMSRPVPIKVWTDTMVFSKRECKMTKKFSEYDVNPQTEDCYMMIDSMYYRLPADLHAQELEGLYRSSFNTSEVEASYRFAFRKIRGVNL